MSLRTRFHSWLASLQPKEELSNRLEVSFDDEAVTTRVVADLEPEWNQTFRWADIVRVCFADGGLHGFDIIHVAVQGRLETVRIPIDAGGGRKFFGTLCDRGFLPEAVWRRAMGDTSGGMHCWPPFEPE